MTKKRFFILLAVFILMLVFASISRAESLTLQWNPVDGADGYKVYYGIASRQYSDPIDAEGEMSLTIPYDTSTMKYLAVTAYNKWGESGYSEELILLDAPKWNTILKVK